MCRCRIPPIKLILGFSALLLTAFVCDHISVSPTESVNYRLFLKRQMSPEETVKGNDFVSFFHAVPEWTFGRLKHKGNIVSEIKTVACIPGQHLEVTNEGMPAYLCDGRLIGRAKTKSPSGRSLEPFHFSGTIPAGNYFVFGSHENSYDSRYYGFVQRTMLKEKLWPIL